MKKSLTFLLSTLCASVALAEPPAPATRPPTQVQQAASALVDKQLVQPLKKSDAKRKRFSRSSPPKARRVRVLDAVAMLDVHGKQFVRFAVDARYSWDDEETWEEGLYAGCVYVDQKQVFVEQGADQHVTATSMLSGEQKEAPADTCIAAPQAEPQVANAPIEALQKI
jgi:hypothetical protein